MYSGNAKPVDKNSYANINSTKEIDQIIQEKEKHVQYLHGLLASDKRENQQNKHKITDMIETIRMQIKLARARRAELLGGEQV